MQKNIGASLCKLKGSSTWQTYRKLLCICSSSISTESKCRLHPWCDAVPLNLPGRSRSSTQEWGQPASGKASCESVLLASSSAPAPSLQPLRDCWQIPGRETGRFFPIAWRGSREKWLLFFPKFKLLCLIHTDQNHTRKPGAFLIYISIAGYDRLKCYNKQGKYTLIHLWFGLLTAIKNGCLFVMEKSPE